MQQNFNYWQNFPSFQEGEKAWNKGSEEAAQTAPIRHLKTLPKMVGITSDTKKNLKWKSFWYMLRHDKNGVIRKNFLRHPLRYGWTFLKSVCKKQSYQRDDDFFYYGIESTDELKEKLTDKEALFVVGFSYCHKPHECPSGRFTDQCLHDPSNSVCRQCFIGKAINTLPKKNTIPLAIPTIHYIGEQIFDIVHAHPNKKVFFLITACELSLQMFGDWGNMVNIQGIGVRLDGRICNTMKAFELSEEGVKPGLTVVQDHTQDRILDILQSWRAQV